MQPSVFVAHITAVIRDADVLSHMGKAPRAVDFQLRLTSRGGDAKMQDPFVLA